MSSSIQECVVPNLLEIIKKIKVYSSLQQQFVESKVSLINI